MNLQFRHGIVKHQTPFNGPFWIQRTSAGSVTIDINADVEATVVAFAHGDADYLIEETQTIVGAWGGPNSNSNSGPIPSIGNAYLYWDIDLITGALSRGWTSIPWIATATTPSNPVHDLHWFDLQQNIMKVYQKPGAAPGFWQNKARVFAAVVQNNSIITPYPVGSQVGLNTPCSAGNIILGTNNVPLRQNDGTLVTTTSSLIVSNTSGLNIQFDAVPIFARAAEEIPAFSAVVFGDNRSISLASSTDDSLQVAGICISALYEQEIGQVICNGKISNSQWNFTNSQIGSALYCGPAGELILDAPLTGSVQQIGIVHTSNSIYVNILSPVSRNSDSPNIPLVLSEDGRLTQLQDGILNIEGTSATSFTVGGRGLLFDDGTSTSPESQPLPPTLQTVYANSVNQGGFAEILLSSTKAFAVRSQSGASFSVEVDGTVNIDGVLNCSVISISPIPEIPGASNVQQALQMLSQNTSTSQLTAVHVVQSEPPFLQTPMRGDGSAPANGRTFYQDEALASWTIYYSGEVVNDLLVQATDSSNQVLQITSIVHDAINRAITLLFASPVSGKAVIITF